jgi:hypothetical protein
MMMMMIADALKYIIFKSRSLIRSILRGGFSLKKILSLMDFCFVAVVVVVVLLSNSSTEERKSNKSSVNENNFSLF